MRVHERYVMHNLNYNLLRQQLQKKDVPNITKQVKKVIIVLNFLNRFVNC